MTLTDDEVDAELHALAQQPRTTGPGEWDRAIARHFYALGLAAIPREPVAWRRQHVIEDDGTWVYQYRTQPPTDDAAPYWSPLYDAAQGGKP